MKAEIQEFQRQNGNVTYTIKELLAGLHVKVDKMNDKLSTKASKKMVIGMFGALLTIIGLLAGYGLLGGG